MIFDTTQVGFLARFSFELYQWNREMTYFTILQTEVCHTSHGCGLSLGKVLVNLIDAIGDVVVSFVEQVTATKSRQMPCQC